jgi:hypothetical protein
MAYHVYIPGVFLGGKGFLFGGGFGDATPTQYQLERAYAAHTFQLLILVFGKIEPERICQALPGFVMVYGGVDDHAVEVKNTGFYSSHLSNYTKETKVGIFGEQPYLI